MSQFAHLAKTMDTAGTAECVTAVEGPIGADGLRPYATLIMKYAGDSNRRWRDASSRFNSKHGLARKVVQGSKDSDALMRSRDIELYPKFVIVDWKNVYNGKGEEVPFSEEDCRDFLKAVPDWVLNEIRMFANTASNFLPDAPTDDEISETAGN